jgi:hypothetical protein
MQEDRLMRPQFVVDQRQEVVGPSRVAPIQGLQDVRNSIAIGLD